MRTGITKVLASGLLVLIASASLPSIAQAAIALPGGTCAKVNTKTKIATIAYTCTKNAKTKKPISKYKEPISKFLTLLWDIGLELGQSVRSIKQCKQEASNDITVATALMESRTLVGPPELQQQMYALTTGKRVWPIKKFLSAKLAEQQARHSKYHDIDYALEPNVKTSPGGLRDIQTIAWVAKRHYGASSFNDLVALGFLKESEEVMINKGQQFLWKLRYGLHLLEGRREDRLLFDKQHELAKLFGYEDDESSLGVEKLMQTVA